MNRSSYSTSPIPNNTSLKSPSPDKNTMNVLTPTKIKYLGNSHSIKRFDEYNTVGNGYRSDAELIRNRRNVLTEDSNLKNFKVNFNLNSN